MSAPIVAFFNSAGGVGTTTLVYHLAWTFSDLGLRVLAADLDPQADLTSAFLGWYALEISAEEAFRTIYTCVEPLVLRQGDVRDAETWDTDGISLLLGDLRLSLFEELLASEWSESAVGKEGGFVLASSFSRILTQAALKGGVDVVLVDLGSNLGAVGRAALLAADYLVVPLAADRFSLQGIRILGPAIENWKKQWARSQRGTALASNPAGKVQPIGYIVQPRPTFLSHPFWVYERSVERIPGEFRRSVLRFPEEDMSVREDPWCLGMLKHYHGLAPLAQEAQKPMFHLKVADGASDSQLQAAQSVQREYRTLAERIAERVGLKLPYLSGGVA